MISLNGEKSEEYGFEPTLIIKRGKYYFQIRELGLTVKGDTLDSAYQDLLKKKEELILKFEEADNLEELPAPASAPRIKEGVAFRELGLFSAKMAIGAVVIAALIAFAGNRVNSTINHNLSRLKTEVDEMVSGKPGRKLEKELHRAVNHEIAPERREKIIKSIRVLVKRCQPFIKELKPLFEDSNL